MSEETPTADPNERVPLDGVDVVVFDDLYLPSVWRDLQIYRQAVAERGELMVLMVPA